MSTSYQVWCKTCSESHDWDLDKGEDLMRELVRHARSIAALVGLIEDAGGDVCLKSSYGFGCVDVRWFAAHSEHELTVRDEYGRLDGECGEHVKCHSCPYSHRCKLARGHTGDHV